MSMKAIHDTPNKTTETPNHPFYKDIFGMGVASVVIVFFLWLIKDMFGLLMLEDVYWARATYIFSGVEAIAFAAAGFLFGREVNRKRAEKAESKADAEAKEAKDAVKHATEANAKGRALVDAIAAKKKGTKQVGRSTSKLSTEALSVSASQLDELHALGEASFPKATR